jgi:hypothetical protein
VIEIFGEGTSAWFTYQNSGDDFIFIERFVESFYTIAYNMKHKILQYDIVIVSTCIYNNSCRSKFGKERKSAHGMPESRESIKLDLVVKI